MRGRKPKPTKLKILQGVDRSDRRNDREASPERGLPIMPKHLDREGRAEWKRISAELYDLGLLSLIDRAALAGYCAAWSRWVKAETKLQELNEAEEPNDLAIKRWNIHCRDAVKQMHQFLTEFGMTPASRTRIKVAPAGGNDPLAEFLQSEAK